jgi:DNA-binding XRE family transcriptional regulator
LPGPVAGFGPACQSCRVTARCVSPCEEVADVIDRGSFTQTVNGIETGQYDSSRSLAFDISRLFRLAIERIITPDL